MLSLGISSSHFPCTSFLFLCLWGKASPILKIENNNKTKYLSLILLPVDLFSIFLVFLHHLILISLHSLPLLPHDHCLYSHNPLFLQSCICPDQFMEIDLPMMNYSFSDTTSFGIFIPQLQKPLQYLTLRPLLPSSNISLICNKTWWSLAFHPPLWTFSSLPISLDFFFLQISIWALSILLFLVTCCLYALSPGKLKHPDGFNFHFYLDEFQTCISGLCCLFHP